ncbi:beta-ketoadipyl-CoA thiolase [Filimonas sp.]|nr:beta-ketoadipyl-CoA thiolase [Filimonas sp.]
MSNAYIIDALRTPIGKYGGSLSTIRPDDLLALTIKALIQRNEHIDVQAIEDVIAGCANQAGEDNRDIARMAALLAGLPVTVGGNTVNRLCASGLQAIMDAGRAIRCGDGDLIIACGVESMTRAPFVMGKSDAAFSRKSEIFDTTIGWRFINPTLSKMHHPYSMGETAENVARQWNVSREEQDRFAYESQLKYDNAHKADQFSDELISVEIDLGKGKTVMFEKDEHPRLTPLEKLGELKPAFMKDGTVTAANASGVNDGAAAILLASDHAVQKYDLQPWPSSKVWPLLVLTRVSWVSDRYRPLRKRCNAPG